MKGRLLDASAIINIMLSRDDTPDLLKAWSILDLTAYEVGNAAWRLVHVQKKITGEQACNLLRYFELVRNGVSVLVIDDMESVKRIAIDASITYYDSAYISAARKHSLSLVTDDRQLGKVASKFGCTVLGSSDI